MDLEQLAYQWKVKSDSDKFGQEEKSQLDEWLKQDVRHRVAFTRATRGWERADRLARVRPLKGEADPDLLLNIDLATDGASEQPASGRTRARLSNSRAGARVTRIAFVSGLAAALCAVSVACWYYIDSMGWEQYATGIGGTEQVPLPDGTRIHLNTDTVVAVRPARREVRLTRGEALIEATKDADHPLKISAGEREFQTEGGRFDVRLRGSDDVELVVDTGRVDVRTSRGLSTFGSGRFAADIVSAGYIARMRPGMIHVAWIAPDDLARKMTWLTGLLSFHGDTLGDAVSEFNRYNRKQIEIFDPSIATRQVGGVFQATDPDSFVAALHVAIGVDAVTISSGSGRGYGKLRLSKARTLR
jgi:transmembrane sensor